MSLTSGTRLGPYEIVAPIGAGGMGEVYRARDTRLNRDVAIKVLPAAFAQDSDRLARFTREAQTLASLNHPNIAQIYGIEHNAIVMELVDGQDLSELIRGYVRSSGVPLADALPIAKQIAEALEAAHELGIVHRDLKPANIKVRADGTVKVLDFGLAKATVGPGFSPGDADLANSPTMTSPAMTEHGLILGTAAYMSPEQAAGKTVDKRSDLWSFGLVFMEMLTGTRVFTGETTTHLLAAVLKDDIDWTTLPANTPPQIRRLLRRCLERDRKRRLDSASAARFEIEDAMTAPSGESGVAPLVLTPAGRRAMWIKRAAVAAIVLAAGFALLKLGAASMTPTPRVLRLAISIPASQALDQSGGTSAPIAPDGTAIVYAGLGPNGTRLYYRPLDRLEGTPLPGTDGGYAARISPSGDWVAFQTSAGGVSELGPSADNISKVSIHGGAAVLLGTVSYGAGLAWAVDEQSIFVGTNTGIVRIPANGGSATQVSTIDKTRLRSGHYMPLALPDGKTILAWVGRRAIEGQAAGSTLAMIEIATGTLTVLDGDAMNPVGFAGGYLVFGRRDRSLGVVPFDPARTRSLRDVIPVPDTAVTRSAGGANADLSATGDLVYVRTIQNQRLAFLDTHGRVIREIEETRTFKNPRVSPDGRWIVMNEQLLSGNIFGDLWLHGVASGEMRRLTNGGNASSPEWTPDGRIVYSQSQLTGPTQAWVVSIDGTGFGEKFISLPTPVIHTVISSDGRYAVVTTQTAQNKRDIYSVDLKGDHPPVPLMNSRFNETTPSISPDGHWLAYVSDETDQEEVYVRPFPVGSGRVQISLGGGGEPRWSKDGRSILYRHVRDFAKAHLAIGPSIRVTEHEALFSGVYRSAEFAETREFDLFADDTIVALKEAETEIVAVTNWIAELKARLRKK